MKKNIFFLITIFLLLFPIRVLGEDLHNLSYEVTDFSISNDGIISISGWSMIDHADNIGGSRGNLETYIIVHSSTFDQNWLSTPNSSLKNIAYKVKAKVGAKYTGGEIVDKFLDRCIIPGNGIGCPNYKDYGNLRRENLNDKFRGVEEAHGGNGLCTSMSYKDSYGSMCIYYDIGFKVEIDMKEVVKQFIDDESKSDSLKFTIASKVTGVTSSGLIANAKLHISPIACKNWNKEYCQANKTSYPINLEFDSDGVHYKVPNLQIGGFASKFVLTAYDTLRDLGFNLFGGEVCNKGGSWNFDYRDNNGVYPKYDLNYGYEGGSGIITSQKDKYEVYYVKCDRATSCGGVVAWPGNSKTCAMAKSWGTVEGNLSFDISSAKKGPQCYALGKGATGTDADCEDRVISSSSNIINDSKSECSNQTFSGSVTSIEDSQYYFKTTKGDLEKAIKGYSELRDKKNLEVIDIFEKYNVKIVGDSYYIPIKFGITLQKSATGNLNFVKKDGESGVPFVNEQIYVDVGRFFNFSMSYDTTISLKSLDNIQYQNFWKVFVKYSYDGVTKRQGDIPIYYALDLNKDKIYKLNNSGDVVWEKSAKDIGNEILNEKIDDLLKGTKKLGNTDLVVKFPDTNARDFSKVNMIGNVGDFRLTYNSIVDRTVKQSYEYTIKPALFKVNGDVCYGDTNSCDNGFFALDGAKGSLYYTPFSMNVDDIFKFRIDADNLSLDSAIKFSYHATCSLKVQSDDTGGDCKPGSPKCPPNTVSLRKKLSYRPIDINTPFPDDNVSENWIGYDVGRMKDSYKNITYVSGYHHSKENFGDFSSYAEISPSDISPNGTSVIVTNYFTRSNGCHNKVGVYDAKKDKC